MDTILDKFVQQRVDNALTIDSGLAYIERWKGPTSQCYTITDDGLTLFSTEIAIG